MRISSRQNLRDRGSIGDRIALVVRPERAHHDKMDFHAFLRQPSRLCVTPVPTGEIVTSPKIIDGSVAETVVAYSTV